MQEDIHSKLVPGAKVRVIQQIPARDHTWTTQFSGVIVSMQQQPAGSWYAHSKSGHLWLDRLTLRKEDGEISTLNLDQYSRIEML